MVLAANKFRVRTPLLYLVALNYLLFYVCYYFILPHSQPVFNATNVLRAIICLVMLPVVMRYSYRRADHIYAAFYSKVLYVCFALATVDCFGIPINKTFHFYLDTVCTVAEILTVVLLVGGKIHYDYKNRDAHRDAIIRDFLMGKDS